MDEKEVHFTEKRVDESWKENVSQEKAKPSGEQGKQSSKKSSKAADLSFSNFVTSLGIQALIRMGELKPPGAENMEVDLEAAQETIDLLLMLKEKTKGNVTAEEETLLNSLIPDLQLKFVQHKMR